MKRRYIIGLAILLFVLPAIGYAADCNTINIPNVMPNKIGTIRAALLNYQQGGVYGICFNMEQPLELNSNIFDTPFLLSIPNVESHDVYIKGLQLRNDDEFPVMHELFKVQHSGSGNVVLEEFDIRDIKKGLLFEGTGKIALNSSKVAGDSAKSGACIDVKSPGAVLSAVQASSCHEGVKVDANGVIIKDKSAIASNHLGVHVASGITGTDVKSSLVYANNDDDASTLVRHDGIRIDDGAMNEVVFYDVVDDEPVPLLDETKDIQYEGRPAYMLLDIPENKKGKVEFYISRPEDCSLPDGVVAYEQNCALVETMTNPIEITAATLAQGPVQTTIPPQYLSKPIVVVFSDDERGTAGISRQFSVSEGGVVAFVANPYDIPTSGGVVDTGASGSSDDEEEQTTGANSMGGEGAMTEGGGGIISAAGAAGGCGGGSSLMGLAWHDASLGGILWCLLLALGAIASVRVVQVKVRRKQ